MKTCQSGLHQYEGRRCSQCALIRQMKWQKNNPEKCKKAQIDYRSRGYKRNAQLKHNYGITLDLYEEMFSAQWGRCKICNRHQSEFKKSLYVDHHHASGRIRGLLCQTCNHAIGLLYEDVLLLKRAIQYLEGAL